MFDLVRCVHGFGALAVRRVAIVLSGGVMLLMLAASAQAACELDKIETFLEDRAFTLAADDKIQLYARRVLRYYGRRDLRRRDVLGSMRTWEQRWPDRIYKYMRIRDFDETDARDACRVTFDYKFIAYDPSRDKTSAGVGRTTLVIAERGPERDLKIVGEWGDVLCRGLSKFARGRC
ncbi:MAG: hypothetical protein AAFR55_02450 [Pseudomonadota bacterium]